MSQFSTAELLSLCHQALDAADRFKSAARDAVKSRVSKDGRIDPAKLEAEQFAVHGFAWLATYVETLRQTLAWAEALQQDGRLGELESLILEAGFAGYLAQMSGGLPMTQVEIVRPAQIGISPEEIATFIATPAVASLVTGGDSADKRQRIGELIRDGGSSGYFGELGLDETNAMVRDQFRRFADEEVAPFAHDWHLKDELIPMPVIDKMCEMGVFGLTIPEEFEGHGMGKTAMCVVSEELCRGYIGVGSLGTRSEIAAELILTGGTEEQKKEFLPRIASGEILPTAVFTEPNTGSDLAHLSTRAEYDPEEKVYKVTGNKTWITHAARAHMMTLLCRTNPDEAGYKGLSMLLAEKPQGTDEEPFPAEGMSGGEIDVIGYRGMKEYEIGFDGFAVPKERLLGGEEGQGFKQLMATFESARIQTAARAVGVAQNAMELGLNYANERKQFGKAVYEFPRSYGKMAWMAVEIMMARQLTYFAAREKDQGRRCDLEAGMAKLLAARVAWSSADNALQVHGGNGFAMEYPISRVLADARILNIFEGAGEIQAQVIARRLLEGAN